MYPIDSFQDHLTNFIIVYPIDSFQDHLTYFCLCTQWLLSRPFDLILSLCIQFTHFKTIWPHCIKNIVLPNWLLSRPFDQILSLCTQLTSFQDHLTQFYHCVPNWLLSRPFDLIMFVYPMTPFKTIWPNFIIVYPIDSFQDHLT